MDSVRKDYFWYYREPVYENGIQIRDMLVFRYDLTSAERPRRAPPSSSSTSERE